MVNTELLVRAVNRKRNYNILNIVVNTERNPSLDIEIDDYNILNIVVNTEPTLDYHVNRLNYNILNIVVNTEHPIR